MHETAFSPANILLPQDCGLTKWAVVACDQYTSQPEYWERVDQFVGDAPSTLRLILPVSTWRRRFRKSIRPWSSTWKRAACGSWRMP